MLKLSGEQAIALGALGIVLLTCALAVGLSVAAQSDAAQELAVRGEMLSRLQVQARLPSNVRGQLLSGKASAAAFLDAPTPGLAVAELQAYVARVAQEQQSALISTDAPEPTARDDALDSIRIRETLELNIKSLQAILHRLESGTPYIFVETLAVQPSTENQRGAEDPTLRVTLGIRALWRRGQT